MFEHLTNEDESFRNKVINANKSLYEACNDNLLHIKSEMYKIATMKNFLSNVDNLNKLYFT